MRDSGADRAIAAFAERQGGKIAWAQLRDLGLSKSAIGRRVERGVLFRDRPGVYAVGHRRTDVMAQWWGAVLTVPRSVVSNATGCAVWDLLPIGGGAIHLTVPTDSGQRRRPGIEVHRARLREDEITTHRGLPVTTVERTLLDLAVSAPAARLQRAVERAEWLRLIDMRKVEDGRPGSRRLREALAEPLTLKRSELERRMLALCGAHGLERPLVNRQVLGFEVDFHWPAARLVVETDGGEFHRTRRAFEEDRRRDAALTAAGWRVVRFTHERIRTEPEAVGALLRALGAPRASR